MTSRTEDVPTHETVDFTRHTDQVYVVFRQTIVTLPDGDTVMTVDYAPDRQPLHPVDVNGRDTNPYARLAFAQHITEARRFTTASLAQKAANDLADWSGVVHHVAEVCKKVRHLSRTGDGKLEKVYRPNGFGLLQLDEGAGAMLTASIAKSNGR